MNDEGNPLDVLICGAGAAGLTLALELARRGVGFCLIDKIDEPFGGSRGKGIQPRTLEIFEDLGIANRLAAVGGPYPPERKYGEDGREYVAAAEQAPPARPSEPYTLPLMVPQFLTERVLRERLAEFGHAPRYGCELVDVLQDADGVTAQVVDAAGTHRIRARFLVATDGGRSFVRHALAVDFPGKTLGVRAIVADVALGGLDRACWHRFNEASMQRHVSLCPLAGTDLFQVQAPIPLEGEVDLSAAGINAMIAERTGRTDIRIDQVFWASAYAMNARLADRYRVGRIFLAGDAAHIHPPTGGQGLNTSVQDAYNLGWKLAAVIAGAADALLDSYEQERRPIAAGMLGLSVKLLGAAKQGDMRRGRETQQLDLYYDASVLVQPAMSSSRIASGTRAPDAPLLGAAGQMTRLFELFKGPHWTLLGYGIEHAALPARRGVQAYTVGERGDVRDIGGHVAEAYGLSPGDVVLVRPDGYVGMTAQVGELHALADYLAALGI
ncbi:FAD-dependent oxidoreductase [Xanthomonas bonasiae]|uniref:FAD-dependent oxidoreductase n=1 Tax=Xanthomonas bonasiae TaxID=2810351 RepID=UPI00197FCB52|nr:FAD-dependent oxidoreductase [Xanthomonas bonasiae]MBN6110578.1 FAD-dependent oxidoreductase [Xanthomonas bonasiae]